jgi:hypothetical protein
MNPSFLLPPTASAETISATILKATDEFSGNRSEPHDDRTLIIFRLSTAPGAAEFPGQK